ncbi:MAG TPA: RDD family protein [Thermoanaerobaculia bacterium]|nr:RDD family protein [Thermoanaerobaculia bacterium]
MGDYPILLNGSLPKRLSFSHPGPSQRALAAPAVRGPRGTQPQEPAIPRETSLLLLRIAAFLIDAITAAVLLIPPASVVSYSLLWFGLSMRPVSWIWWAALFVFLLFILFRDARGRSMGKRVMAVEIRSPTGTRLGWFRSAARNLPLVVPGWNLVEVVMIFAAAGGRRSGDRIAGTTVVEE